MKRKMSISTAVQTINKELKPILSENLALVKRTDNLCSHLNCINEGLDSAESQLEKLMVDCPNDDKIDKLLNDVDDLKQDMDNFTDILEDTVGFLNGASQELAVFEKDFKKIPKAIEKIQKKITLIKKST